MLSILDNREPYQGDLHGQPLQVVVVRDPFQRRNRLANDATHAGGHRLLHEDACVPRTWCPAGTTNICLQVKHFNNALKDVEISSGNYRVRDLSEAVIWKANSVYNVGEIVDVSYDFKTSR